MDLAALLAGWTSGRGPLYRQLADALGDRIGDGSLQTGTRLPAERQLSRALAVSRSTVVAAYEHLRREGLIDSRRGSGSYVLHRAGPPPGPRERRLAAALDENTIFRGLMHADSELLDLRAAYVVAPEELPDEAFALAAGDLTAIRRDHSYLPWGLPALREALAAYQTGLGLATTPDRLLVTSGAQQAITLVAALCVQPGDVVLLETPTYPGAIDTFTAAGARLVTVEAGDVDRLEEAARRLRPRLVFLMPVAQNPTGAIMPAHHRRRVARVAAANDLLVVEDNTLAELTFGRAVPPPIAADDEAGRVLTIGSLSKLFWGGLRTGWVTGPAELVHRLARVKTLDDLGTPFATQTIAVRLLERTGEIRAARRRTVTARRDLLMRSLEEALPTWRWATPEAGLCLWVRLPAGTGTEFVHLAARHGVAIAPGTVCTPDRSHADHLRLPFGQPPEVLAEAVERLAAAWHDYTRLLGSRAYTDAGVVV